MGVASTARFALLPLSMLATGCAELPTIESGICGNAIVEPGEACDGFVAQESQACRPAGSEIGECRFDCTAGHECPPGYACSARDGICRTGSGDYAAWGTPSSLSASRIVLGDFDGDARDDVVTLGNPNPIWQTLPKIAFLSDEAELLDPFEPKLPILSPAVIDLDPSDRSVDAREQLVFATNYGIASISADTNRVVTPDSYPFQALGAGVFYRVVTIHGLSTTAMGDGVLVLFGDEENTVVVGSESGTEIQFLNRPIDAFVGDLVSAEVDQRTPCSEFLFAFKDEPSVYAISPCNSDGEWQSTNTEPKVLLSLDDNHVVRGQLLQGDVNGDGLLDLVVGDELMHPYVSFGLGDGRFVADLGAPETTLGKALRLSFTEGNCVDPGYFAGYPLAIGDLNADGRDDWVLPTGIVLTKDLEIDSTARVFGCAGNSPFVGSWAVATISDLNRDDNLDLVAAAANDPDLDIYLGTGTERMNRFGLATEGVVSRLLSADFDGDLIGDLAFVTRTDSLGDDDSTIEAVSVAFGELDGAPTDVAWLGDFRNIRQIGAANYVAVDAIGELGVVSQRDSKEGEQLAVFIGNAGRHPIAPLGLSLVSLDSENYFDFPLAAAVGHFEDPERMSLLALGTDCALFPCSDGKFRLWFSVYRPGKGFENPTTTLPLFDDIATLQNTDSALGVHTIAGDLNRDGLDELLVLAAAHRANTTNLHVVRHSPEMFSREPGLLKAQKPLVPALTLAGNLLPESAPTLIDLDIDGFVDLVLLLRDPSGKLGIYAAWNDGEGRLEAGKSPFVTFDGQVPRGLFGTADRLVAITTEQTFTIPRLPGERGRRAAVPLKGLPGGKAVALGDMTGDGLLDLAISMRGTLSLFAEVELEP